MMKNDTAIRFLQVNRRTGVRRQVWLTGCTFADGDGMRVKAMTCNADRSRAQRFTLEVARTIAVQFCDTPAWLENAATGELLVDETAKLQAEQLNRHETMRRWQAEIRAEFNKALEEATRRWPAIEKALRS